MVGPRAQYISSDFGSTQAVTAAPNITQSWPYEPTAAASLQQSYNVHNPEFEQYPEQNTARLLREPSSLQEPIYLGTHDPTYQTGTTPSPFTIIPSQRPRQDRSSSVFAPTLPPTTAAGEEQATASLYQPAPSSTFRPDFGATAPEMQNYPSPPSPHSDISDLKPPTHSFFPSIPFVQAQGQYMHPTRSVSASPAISTYASSSAAQISSPFSHTSGTPNLNPMGQMQCPYPKCALSPKIFTRKSEYQKHMDKHIRPYVCEEPECRSKRLGFTYSGGLTRHQKEVHGRLGGAKGKCWCPHVGCKRNTGAGFSRKENLTEHLRRVHKGIAAAGSEGNDGNASPKASAPAVEVGQKRQRTEGDITTVSVSTSGSGSQGTSVVSNSRHQHQQQRKKRRRRFVEIEEDDDDDDDEDDAEGDDDEHANLYPITSTATAATENPRVMVPEKGMPSLRKQISKLWREMRGKEERIKRLEDRVGRLERRGGG